MRSTEEVDMTPGEEIECISKIIKGLRDKGISMAKLKWRLKRKFGMYITAESLKDSRLRKDVLMFVSQVDMEDYFKRTG